MIGTSAPLFWSFPWNFVLFFAWGFYLIFLRKWIVILSLFAACIYGFYTKTEVSDANLVYFSPSSVKPHQSPFMKGLIYEGTLIANGQSVPASVYHPRSASRPSASADYILKGQLKKRGNTGIAFKAKEWIFVKKRMSFVEMRFQMKEKMRKVLEEKLKKPRVAPLLSSLITGDVEERSLVFEFSRLGLQHLLAISGFHFGVLIAFCSYFLSLFLDYKPKIFSLILLINLYFLFVGPLPAVQRSYMTALFFLLGKWMGKRATPLNLLGTSLLVEVTLNPLIPSNLGFQLSFLSCAGIFIGRPLFMPLCLKLFPKRATLIELTIPAKHGYLLTSFLREALNVTLSVNAAILPLLLFHFHTFPLLSFLYNLFFPFLLGASLFLLLLSLALYLLFPPLASPFFFLTDFLTGELLDLTSYPPLFLDYSIRCTWIPSWSIPFYLFALFWLSIRVKLGRIPTAYLYGDRSSAG